MATVVNLTWVATPQSNSLVLTYPSLRGTVEGWTTYRHARATVVCGLTDNELCVPVVQYRHSHTLLTLVHWPKVTVAYCAYVRQHIVPCIWQQELLTIYCTVLSSQNHRENCHRCQHYYFSLSRLWPFVQLVSIPWLSQSCQIPKCWSSQESFKGIVEVRCLQADWHSWYQTTDWVKAPKWRVFNVNHGEHRSDECLMLITVSTEVVSVQC